MRLLLTGNNDGPLRVAAALRRAGLEVPVAVALQKQVSGVLAEAYLKERYVSELVYCPDEAATLEVCVRLQPTHILNSFANFRFRRLLDVATCLNVHLSPLPHYRGRHPLQWALINGDSSYGITCHYMTKKIDDGAILWQSLVDIEPLSSVAQLREQLMVELDDKFGNFWADFTETGGTPRENAIYEGAYVPRRYPIDSELIEWDDPEKIVRKVMALRSGVDPAYVSYKGQPVVTRFARLTKNTSELTVNYINLIRRDGRNILTIQTPTCNVVELSELSGIDEDHLAPQ